MLYEVPVNAVLTLYLMSAVVCHEVANLFDMFNMLNAIDHEILDILHAPKTDIEICTPMPTGKKLVNLLREYTHLFSHTKFMIRKRERKTLPLYEKLASQNGPLFLQTRFDVDALCKNHFWTHLEMGWIHRLFAKAAKEWGEFRMTDIYNMNMTWVHTLDIIDF